MIQLWDGKKYDDTLLMPECFELVKYAAKHDRLREVVDEGVLEARRTRHPVSIVTSSALYLLLVLSIGVTSWLAGVEQSVALSFTAGVAVLAGLLLFASTLGYRRTVPRTIAVQDDMLTVSTRQRQESYRFTDCCWYLGKISDDAALRDSLAKGPAVMIVAPSGTQFACGLDAKQRALWQMFCEVAGLRRVMRRNGLAGILLCITGLASPFLAGFGTWMLASAVAPTLQTIVGVWAADLLPRLSVTAAAWAAPICFLCMVPGMYYGTRPERELMGWFSVLLPLVMFGDGLRTEGLLTWQGALHIPILLLTILLLYFLTRWTLCTLDRR